MVDITRKNLEDWNCYGPNSTVVLGGGWHLFIDPETDEMVIEDRYKNPPEIVRRLPK